MSDDLREALRSACLRLQTFLDTFGDVGDATTQAGIDDWLELAADDPRSAQAEPGYAVKPYPWPRALLVKRHELNAWHGDVSFAKHPTEEELSALSQFLNSHHENAALPAPATASAGWQPIDSAPKDGTEFIACNVGFQPFSCVYHEGQFIHLDANGEIIAYSFTHWMPLPAAPTKRSATDPATAPEGEEVTADDLADFIDGLGILMVTPITDDDECAEVARALLSTYKITKRSAT